VFNPDNTVSFQTSHLSVFQATTIKPRAFSGRFIGIELVGSATDKFGGSYGFGFYNVTSDGQSASIDASNDDLTWQDGGLVAGSGPVLQQRFDSDQLDVAVPSDDKITLTDPAKPASVSVLRRGRSDDVIVGEKFAAVFLRRIEGEPTLSQLTGRWIVFDLDFQAQSDGQQLPGTDLQVTGETGSVTIAADGTFSAGSLGGFRAESDFPKGLWNVTSKTDVPDGGTSISVADGQIFLGAGSGGGQDSTRLYPVLNGDVLVGRTTRTDQSGGADSELLFLVRPSSKVAKSAISGNYVLTSHELDVVDAKVSSDDQGFAFIVQTLTAAVDAAGNAVFNGTATTQTHDGQGTAQTATDVAISPRTPHLTLSPDGSFTDSDGGFGALSRDGGLFLHAQFSGRSFSLTFGVPSVQ